MSLNGWFAKDFSVSNFVLFRRKLRSKERTNRSTLRLENFHIMLKRFKIRISGPRITGFLGLGKSRIK